MSNINKSTQNLFAVTATPIATNLPDRKDSTETVIKKIIY